MAGWGVTRKGALTNRVRSSEFLLLHRHPDSFRSRA
jgi:hypothetical protein